MKPLSVTIERFGSFVERQTFTFPDGPGLYFMQGRNEVEPKLGSNGSGKSTLWKALTWCLFGKDPKGLKAGDVANWETPKGASVIFTFEVDGTERAVERTHAPNKWVLRDSFGATWDLAKDETNAFSDMLRLEYETWLQCVLLAQGEPYFLDLRADAKAAVFSEVMGLDRWLKLSARAADRLKENEQVVWACDVHMAEIRGRLKQMQDDALGVAEHIADWDRSRIARLEYMSAQHETAALRSNHLKVELKKAETAPEFARLNIEGDQAAIDKAMVEVSKLTETHQRRVEAMAAARERWRAATEHQDALVVGLNCPVCGGHVDGFLRDSAAELAGIAEEEAEAAKAAADRAANDLRTAGIRLQEAQNRAQKTLAAIDQYQRGLNAARITWEAAERELDRIENEAEALTNEANPHRELANVAAENQRILELEAARVEHSHSIAAERSALLGFWVRGFKDVRLNLIAEALDHFALEANSCAQTLGLNGWELVFEVDRETKAGSIKSGFNVFVKSPHNDRQVPWEAWSGGESQRLRLAAQLGLSNLIRATTGADIALEVWDEPTEGMSDRGIADLLDALTDRARVEQRQIWVVDHRVLGYANWDGGVTVVKQKQGSRFE